jgi:ssDNA-binding Zn-finger/Zn-ribbon topoisomerase 1
MTESQRFPFGFSFAFYVNRVAVAYNKVVFEKTGLFTSNKSKKGELNMKKGKNEKIVKREYVIRYEDGSFATLSKVYFERKTMELSRAFCFESAEKALDYFEITQDGDSLFEKRGNKVYLVGSFLAIGLYALDTQLAELKQKDETEVYVCPDCGWTTEQDNYTRCQACWANDERVTLDTVIKSELEREEYEKHVREIYLSSLHLFKVTLWNGDEVNPDAEVVLTVARSEEEAKRKAEKKKPSPEYQVTEAELVNEVDGFSIKLMETVL